MFNPIRSFRRRRAKPEIEHLEAVAEEAYTAMYDAKRYEHREYYDDAQIALLRALELAKRAGMADAVERIEKRRDHIQAVYFSQFM